MRNSRRLFQGSELIRLISMIGMLIVLGSLMVVIAKTNQAPQQLQASSAGAGPVLTRGSDPEKSPQEHVIRPDLTDQDSEQRQAATEEFQAVSDKTTEIQPEEMAAYWRLLTWVKQQPFHALDQRSKSDFILNDLLQEPGVHRGELLRLELNVRRVLSYEVPDNRLGVKRLYEIWGWTKESLAWPYVGIVTDLPKGFPIGSDISERAVFCGYFFKLQGYLEAGADPRARPLSAPLLIGRIEVRPQKQVPLVGTEGPWLIGLSAVAGLMLLTRVGWIISRRKKRRVAPMVKGEIQVLPADQWLEGMQRAGLDTFETRNPKLEIPNKYE